MKRSKLIFFTAQIMIGLLMGAVLADPAALSEDRIVREHDLKAAYIYNIIKFVDWPESARHDPELRIGIIGADPFGSSIEIIKGKIVGKRRITVLRSQNLQTLKHCHALFISRSESRQVEWIARNASSLNILTFGDTAGFASRGIIVNFFLQDNKLRFEINIDAARRAGLAISSQVLKLGRIVK